MATAPSVPTTFERRPILHRPHRPWLAAVLSFIFPGLGQAYAGKPRMAAVFAIPVVLLITVGLVLVGLLGETLRNGLLSPGFLVGVLAVDIALLVWRAVAISHAGLSPATLVRGAERRAAVAVVGALVLLSIAMHGWVGVVVAHLNGTLTQVFDQAPGPVAPGAVGGETGGEDTGGVAEEPVNAPDYRWDGEERINVLLLGSDATPGRDHILTDVILVVSIDPVERTAVMVSIPRDTGFLPLPDSNIHDGGLFPAKANELAGVAATHPELWCPDLDITAAQCGIRTVERSVSLYLGIEIHHYALVDMAGFARLIDALGGVDLCLPGRLVDPEFDGSLENVGDDGRLVLPEGCHRYDGLDALAYARSRQGWIEMPDGTRVQQTDFDRNERQQRVLLALRGELADADLIFELPAVLRAVGETVSTDFPRDQAGDLASLLPLITGPDIDRVVLGYPEHVALPLEPDVNYLLVPRRDAIRTEMSRLFGADELRGWYLGTDAPSPEEAELDSDATAHPRTL